MLRTLSCLTLCLLLLIFISPHLALAKQTQHTASYFSFLESYLIAFTNIDSYNKRVLAAAKGVNEYRASLGLSPVKSSAETCSFAATRAQEIANGFTHDGFYNRVNNHTIPYASWSHAVENIAQAPDYKKVVTLWKNSPEHAANIRDNTPYVCIMQYDSYYAYEGMRP